MYTLFTSLSDSSVSSIIVTSSTLPPPLSLHDALPIWDTPRDRPGPTGQRSRCRTAGDRLLDHLRPGRSTTGRGHRPPSPQDRKSTRLNSSHVAISYAVFCLKKKISH